MSYFLQAFRDYTSTLTVGKSGYLNKFSELRVFRIFFRAAFARPNIHVLVYTPLLVLLNINDSRLELPSRNLAVEQDVGFTV